MPFPLCWTIFKKHEAFPASKTIETIKALKYVILVQVGAVKSRMYL